MRNKIIIGAICLLALIGCLSYIFKLRNDLKVSEQNLATSREQIQTLTLKNGRQLATINSYILDKKQLQEYLDISKAEIKELEKKVGKISYISKIETKILFDTIVVEGIRDSTSIDTVYNVVYDSEWIKFKSKNTIKNDKLYVDYRDFDIPVPLQVGLTNDYRIWVKSDNPYLNIVNIQGAVIEGSRINPKPKRFGLGIQVGVGGQYDLIQQRFGVGPYVGVGVTYILK